MPCRRHTSVTFAPPSASFKMPMISYDRSQGFGHTKACAASSAQGISLEIGAPVVATVDQTLIRGLGPHDNSSSEGCLALLSGIDLRPSIIGRGFLLVGPDAPTS